MHAEIMKEFIGMVINMEAKLQIDCCSTNVFIGVIFCKKWIHILCLWWSYELSSLIVYALFYWHVLAWSCYHNV